MDTLTKKMFSKSYLIFFLAFSLLLFSESNVEAKFIKKITVEPFSNPVDWEKSFKPGKFFSLMLENSLTDSGFFQMVPFKEIEANVINKLKSQIGNKEKKEEKTNKDTQRNVTSFTSLTNTPLSQYKVRGNILIFDPDTNPLKKGHTKKEARFHKEQASVQISIELVNLHTGRLLAKKIFTAHSNTGRKTFDLNSENINYKTNDLKNFSSGKVMLKLQGQIQKFIYNVLDRLPLEGDLILVDNSNNSATINLGKTNGIMVRDIFHVYSVQSSFDDPIDKVDLGDMYIRKGVIKIREVQGRFSRAKILVGQGLSPGDLVVPKVKESKSFMAKDQSWMRGVIWGDYKGLPSLSE